MNASLRNLVLKEEGQNLVEYTLMIGVVVTVIWVSVSVFGIPSSLEAMWTDVAEEVAEAPSASGS